MQHFFLATVISYVVYLFSRVALTINLYLRGENLEETKTVRGFFPNLWVVGIIVGYGTTIIHLTIFLALAVKHYLF